MVENNSVSNRKESQLGVELSENGFSQGIVPHIVDERNVDNEENWQNKIVEVNEQIIRIAIGGQRVQVIGNGGH